MTRIVEGIDSDNDREFLDLKDLLEGVKGKKPVPKRRVLDSKSVDRSIKKCANEKEQNYFWESEDSCGSTRERREKGKESTRAVERSVKKKRVLGKRDDNPLLRPIGKLAREERVRTVSSEVFSAKIGTKVAVENVKTRKVGEGRAAKAAPVEVEGEPIDEVGQEDGDDRTLDFEHLRASRAREPSFELSRARPMDVKATKQTGGVTFTGTNESRSATSKVDSDALLFGQDDGHQNLSGLDAAASRKGRGTPIESLATVKASNVNSTRQMGTMGATDKGKTKSAPVTITIDSEDDDPIQEEEPEQLLQSGISKSKRSRDPLPRTKSKFILTDTEEEDSIEDDDSDGMSDFIVSDNEPLDEDDSVFEVPPPATRSARKLFRGRRPMVSESEDDQGLDLEMGRLRVDDDVFGAMSGEVKEANLAEGEGGPRTKPPLKPLQMERPKDEGSLMRPSKKKSEALPPSSDIEDPFTLRYSPSENKRKVSRKPRFKTPPSSPKLKPRILPSPAKLPRIPTSPHRQSSDAFWSQDVVNDWNDEYSPRKAPKPTSKPLTGLGDGTHLFSPRKSPVKQDRLTKDAKKAFSQIKHDLSESFLKELDEKITNGKIAELSASTGGVKIIWSKKLNTTAGRANWKRETIRSKSTNTSENPGPTFRHHAAIELAEKVIDEEGRLLNVIAHEFCHLANFMVSNIRTNPHGKEFKAWGAKCSREFADRGIEVTTKHSYEIDYKYIWECENCGMLFKRHSKSIDPLKHGCGVCKSKLLQTKPVPRAGGKEGGMTGYQAFVKENMKLVREENPGSPQKEIMALVGKRYQEYKAMKSKESSVEEVGSKESTPVDVNDDVGIVIRKLDFLDLTSP